MTRCITAFEWSLFKVIKILVQCNHPLGVYIVGLTPVFYKYLIESIQYIFTQHFTMLTDLAFFLFFSLLKQNYLCFILQFSMKVAKQNVPLVYASQYIWEINFHSSPNNMLSNKLLWRAQKSQNKTSYKWCHYAKAHIMSRIEYFMLYNIYHLFSRRKYNYCYSTYKILHMAYKFLFMWCIALLWFQCS